MELGLLMLRMTVGLTLAAHGAQKLFGWFNGPGLDGTAQGLEHLGYFPGRRHALMAGLVEIGGGLLLALGLLTPLAAAGIIGVMVVAIVVDHWHVGWFIFRKGEGMEYCLMIAVTAFSVATIGAGEYSIDHALGWDVEGWWGAAIAGILGVGGALVQLAVCYRRPVESARA